MRESEEQKLLPIWERENRPDRIEVKPIYKEGENLVFSPVDLYVLMERWLGGFDSLYLLYEYGLDNIMAEVKKEEQENQTQMVTDVSNLFKNDFLVNKDLYLDHRFSKENYPKDNDLGDYDVLEINSTTKTICNIVCKFFQRVGSISEFAKHQNSFFKAGKDVMFNKRIKILNENYKKILKSLQINDEAEYKIK